MDDMDSSENTETLFDFGVKADKPDKVKKAAAGTSKAPAKSSKAKKAKEKENTEDEDPMQVFESIEHATEGGKKRLSIERIYQKKSQLEHILLRPDTYIGSVESLTQSMWVYDPDLEKMVMREITFVPGLYKIFDEILVNAADNKQRDRGMNTIKVNIDQDKNEISIWNNGKGIPVVEHQVEKVYVPELIFGTLLTSSNYDDSQRKVTGGRNGYGAKLCNIFSTKFTVETSCKEYKKSFKQTWTNNMQKTDSAVLSDAKADDFTKITFRPDLKKFKMSELDRDIVQLMYRRAYDVAGSSRGVKVFLNGKKLPVAGFKGYVEQYLKDRTDDNGEPLKVVYEQVGDRWEVAVTVSDKGFQQVSFVNSIATTKGGRHVDYVADQITSKLIESIKKKMGKSGINIKPFQIKNHMWVFVNCLIENPTFDSQTKENMTLQSKSFGSKCDLTEKFIQQTTKCGISESVLMWVKFKQQAQLDQKCSGKKHTKLKGVAKLEDANDAGTKNSKLCTLILTEGDSAKSLAVSGLGVVGRDHYGVFPLKGKVLNVREAAHKQIMENAEINSLIKILGLQYKKKYNTEEDMKTLRYGKVMVMADQDQDGSHIKGLVVNFIHHNWPSLVKQNFVEEFITPIVKATKGNNEHSFFSLPEYQEWKTNTPNWHTWKIKYYKGLGTSTAKEAKEYFSDMRKHRIKFKYRGQEDDDAIELAFSKKKIEERKDWLTKFMQERKDRRALGMAEDYLYTENTQSISYQDFINKELILFSNMDNERSIPSLMDGLKPGQRKVLFTCFKRNDKREVKVAQLAGSVAEMSAYHHGEASLMGTIVNLAQNYVGSNNVNFLLPIGQFGTRLQGGKDSASPRYIFTMLSPVTRALFNSNDEPCLRYLREDNQRIEPEWYCPIIPTVLVNGSDGIGTGWSTKVVNYNPREIVENIRRMLRDEPMQTMHPWYKGFKGTIEPLDATRYVMHGEVSIVDNTTLEITELPIETWTQNYKESVLEPMLGGDKTPQMITDFKEYHTDTTVKFVVKLTEANLAKLEEQGLHKVLKLQKTLSVGNMVLFDPDGVLRKYNSVDTIMEDFVKRRKKLYHARKEYLEGMLKAQALKLSNQARFILEKIEGKIKIENKKKKFIVQQLIDGKYDPDPVKRWKDERKRKEEAEGEETEETADEGEGTADEEQEVPADSVEAKLSDYDYLVTMSLIKLSEEEKDKLLKERDNKQTELHTIEAKTTDDLWVEDLDLFMQELDKQEEKEAEDERAHALGLAKKGPALGKGKAAPKMKQTKLTLAETRPSPMGRRVEPRIDAALKQRMEKADQAKENKALGKGRGRGKKTTKEDEDADPLETSSLFERVAKRSPDVAKLMTKKDKGIARFLTTTKKSEKKEGDDVYDLVDGDVNGDAAPTKKTAAGTKRKAPAGGKKPAAKKQKKKDPWEESDSDEESDAIDISDSEDDDYLDEDQPKKTKAPAKAAQKIVSDSDASGDEAMGEEKDDEEPPKKGPAKNPLTLDSDASGDEQEPVKVPAKKVPAKKAPAKKKPAFINDDSDASGDEKPKKKVAKQRIESDDEDVVVSKSPSPVAPKERAGRARKAVKYNFDDSEESVGGADDESDEEYKGESD